MRRGCRQPILAHGPRGRLWPELPPSLGCPRATQGHRKGRVCSILGVSAVLTRGTEQRGGYLQWGRCAVSPPECSQRADGGRGRMDRRAETDVLGGAARDPGRRSGRVCASACRGRGVWLGGCFQVEDREPKLSCCSVYPVIFAALI